MDPQTYESMVAERDSLLAELNGSPLLREKRIILKQTDLPVGENIKDIFGYTYETFQYMPGDRKYIIDKGNPTHITIERLNEITRRLDIKYATNGRSWYPGHGWLTKEENTDLEGTKAMRREAENERRKQQVIPDIIERIKRAFDERLANPSGPIGTAWRSISGKTFTPEQLAFVATMNESLRSTTQSEETLNKIYRHINSGKTLFVSYDRLNRFFNNKDSKGEKLYPSEKDTTNSIQRGNVRMNGGGASLKKRKTRSKKAHEGSKNKSRRANKKNRVPK